MPAQPSFPNPAADGTDQQAADAQYFRAVLHELIGIGMNLARNIGAQAEAPEAAPAGQQGDKAPAPAIDSGLSASFDRIARAVRRTILLAQRIDEPPKAAPKAAPNTVDRAAARRRILREVENAIDRKAFTRKPQATPLDTDAIHAELHERMDRPELAEALDHDIATRPVADIVADIVRDLGMNFEPFGVYPSRRRTPADIAALCARAAARPGSAPPTPSPGPKPPTPTRRPPSVMVPIPDDPPPDLAEMLALCTQLIGDG